MRPRISKGEIFAVKIEGWQITLKLGALAYLYYYGILGLQLALFALVSWHWGFKTKRIAWEIYAGEGWQHYKTLLADVVFSWKRIDPRDKVVIPKERRARCRHCNIITTTKYPACWMCHENRFGKTKGAPSIFMKHGERLFGSAEIRKIENANQGQGAIDLLQPTRHYDRHSKRWYTNPEFVKHWGDPYVGDHTSH
jgi:hypothetical protein